MHNEAFDLLQLLICFPLDLHRHVGIIFEVATSRNPNADYFYFHLQTFILWRVKANTHRNMTGLFTSGACCRRIPEPRLPSGAHKSLRGMNETDIKETNCGVMCTNKTSLTFSYGTPQFLC